MILVDLKFGWYMILIYSEFSLDMFHYIVKIQRQNKNPKQ